MRKARDDNQAAGASKVERSFLSRLARDRRGNTLAMMAALLIPLLAMVGSGVDMARAYMAKAKLQTACDSAATAARRVMGASAFNDTARQEGKRFFRFNFPVGTMQTTTFEPSVEAAATDASVVEVRASTNVPTEIMRIFGATSIPISVTCRADKDYVNNDIMLVLDVTLSMNCEAGSGSSCQALDREHANSRLRRMREGAVGLYRALEDASGVRTRYGFLPYSMTANVGRDLAPGWMRDPARYRARNTGTSSAPVWSDCVIGTASTCVLRDVSHDTAWFNSWRGAATPSWTTNPNQGCVEERASIGSSGAPITISTNVTENDINLVSTTDAARQWNPYDPVAQRGENLSLGLPTLPSFCPRPARRLAEYATEAAFQAEMNRIAGSQTYTGTSPFFTGRAAGGYTFHDVGMIWGMRYISSGGMFAAQNPTMLNSIPVQKHIVLLTDGVMSVEDEAYTTYGVDWVDRRLGTGNPMSPGITDAVRGRHTRRFLNACTRAREMGITVWVIVLDTGPLSEMQQCASSPGHYYVSNGSDLEEIFSLIGRGIGKLRLTQ
jgi:Flp pilus assembly protein TadG